jgi:cell division protein FtsB
MKVKKPKEREEKVGLPKLWVFVLLVLGALILGDLNQRMADARRLEEEAILLEAEVQELEEDITRLQEEIQIANSEVYIERWAHEEAKWVRQGEILVIPVTDTVEEPVLGPPEEPDLPVLNNMEIWLKLLFGQ